MTNQPLFADMPDLTEKPAVPEPQTPEPLSVSALSQALKGLVETNFSFVRVKGEISGLKKAASGHLYFSLKDDEAVLNGICWRGGATKLSVAPQDGLEVVCTGKITTYPGRSNYQMIVDSMEAAGEGALLKLLEERRKKLLAEGLFAPERKKKIPFLPEVIGVVTSPSGAVIRDIMHRLNDRFPRRVLLWGALMQGDGAAEQVAAGIRGFNAIPPQGLDTPSGHIPRPDVLIVARGGGSLEDLWAFNEEIVVRAAAESDIPLISAVGHETDTTLIDYAADLRAPTPTGAAEKAVLLFPLFDFVHRQRGCPAFSVQQQSENQPFFGRFGHSDLQFRRHSNPPQIKTLYQKKTGFARLLRQNRSDLQNKTLLCLLSKGTGVYAKVKILFDNGRLKQWIFFLKRLKFQATAF